jgi:hypothetical protein
MRVLDEEKWSWMLFAEGDAHYLSVACGSVAIFLIDIELTSDERGPA